MHMYFHAYPLFSTSYARNSTIRFQTVFLTFPVVMVRPASNQLLQECNHGGRCEGPLRQLEGLEVVEVHCERVGRAGGRAHLHQLCQHVPHLDVWEGGRDGVGMWRGREGRGMGREGRGGGWGCGGKGGEGDGKGGDGMGRGMGREGKGWECRGGGAPL